MSELFIDLETTFQVINNQKDPSPFLSDNFLVSVGYARKETDITYYFLNHKELDLFIPDIPQPVEIYEKLEQELKDTSILIAHNAKFELSWLKAVGLEYKGKIADTMIRSYVLAKGQKLSVSLEECCKRASLTHKKSELVEEYLKENIGFDVIPMPIVEEYGRYDVITLRELYYWQIEQLNARPHLWPTVLLMEEFCQCLTSIEFNGIKIDVKALDELEKEYKNELKELEERLNFLVKEVMGDTPINLDSPEQLSWVLYSRKVTDKKKWKEIFNLGTELRGSVVKPKYKPKMSNKDFVSYVQKYTEVLYKTIGSQCPDCAGLGSRLRSRKDGSSFKKTNICKCCMGTGVRYEISKVVAGFKCIPSGPGVVSQGGFSTNHDGIEKLIHSAKGNAKEFIEGIQRSNSIRSYLNTFVDGIRRGLRNNSILHPSFMQCVTATGRLSSRNPNFQNIPRGNTFPVRKCIVSRFDGGCILSGDAKQLEFRIAGELSGDEQIFKDVIDGIDVHAATAKWTLLSRQDSKPFTFAPIYGASDRGKAENIAAYFRYFQNRYEGLFNAHIEWQDKVLDTGSFILPSGREFIYPNTKRKYNGSVTNSTIIANYPVQAFATADLMPIFCINTMKLYEQYGLKSLIILEVHDDVTADVYPGELEIAAKLMVEAFSSIPQECIKRYGYTLRMPLEVELKVGPNWLEQKEYVLH